MRCRLVAGKTEKGIPIRNTIEKNYDLVTKEM